MTGAAHIVRGDALHLPLADNTVDLVATSPPFLNLRSYQDGGRHYEGQVGTGTQQQFLDDLWAATAEMKRVVKPSGSIWVELGDSYTDKSLNNSPHRYAVGCTDRLGLYQRAEVIWDRPNGLPESVTDRVRRSHSTWFHFTVSPRYFSAVDEIRETYTLPQEKWGHTKGARIAYDASQSTGYEHNEAKTANPLGKLPGSVWTIPTQPLTVPAHLGIDHFAAYPMEWPRRIIQGWSPAGICVACGEGRRPTTHKKPMEWRPGPKAGGYELDGQSRKVASGTMLAAAETTITGYACNCTPYVDHPGGESRRALGEHPSSMWANPGGGLANNPRNGPWREYLPWTPPDTTPSVVLDPFGGTGTTALVAKALGRTGITIDMSADYCRLATWRTQDPAQIAKASGVDKPPAEVEGQLDLFGEDGAA